MTWSYVESASIVCCWRFILPGLITLMLLVSMAAAQSTDQAKPRNIGNQPVNPEAVLRLADGSQVTEPASRFTTVFVDGLPASPWWQTTSRSPLPPASIFALQANLRKYLDTWPTAGSTMARDKPPEEELHDEELM